MLFTSSDYWDDYIGNELIQRVTHSYQLCVQNLYQWEVGDTKKDSIRNLISAFRDIKNHILFSGFLHISPLLQGIDDIIDELENQTLQLTANLADLINLSIQLVVVLVKTTITAPQKNPYDLQLADICDQLTKVITATEHQQNERIIDALSMLLKKQPLPLTLQQEFGQSLQETSAFRAKTLQNKLFLQYVKSFGVAAHDDIEWLIDQTSNHLCHRDSLLEESQCVTKLALLMNQRANCVVDPSQLVMAGICNHLSVTKLLTENESTQQCDYEQHQALHLNLLLVAETLHKTHWQEAKQMIEHSQKLYDCTDVYAMISEEPIVEGAKILSIAEHCFATLMGNAPQTQLVRPLERVIAEINHLKRAKFCPFWVNIFNQVMSE